MGSKMKTLVLLIFSAFSIMKSSIRGFNVVFEAFLFFFFCHIYTRRTFVSLFSLTVVHIPRDFSCVIFFKLIAHWIFNHSWD